MIYFGIFWKFPLQIFDGGMSPHQCRNPVARLQQNFLKSVHGDPQKFCTSDTPYHPYFITFLRNNIRKFSKFVLLILPNFFEKFPKISKKFVKFLQLFQNRKNISLFELKLVQNHFIFQNLVKKTANFFFKTAIFSKLSALKICSFDT